MWQAPFAYYSVKSFKAFTTKSLLLLTSSLAGSSGFPVG